MRERMKLEEARAAISNALDKEGLGAHVALVPPLKFAKQLASYRLRIGLSRRELAEMAGCTVRELADWEDAEAYPAKDQIGRLAWALAGEDAGDVRDYWEYLVADAQAYLRGE
jgi:DNA-binding transcriptional regulator YiaG